MRIGPRQIASYARAELSSLTHAPVDERTVVMRLTVCKSCAKFETAVNPSDVGFCRACGCPHWRRSALAAKAMLPRSTCPLGRW